MHSCPATDTLIIAAASKLDMAHSLLQRASIGIGTSSLIRLRPINTIRTSSLHSSIQLRKNDTRSKRDAEFVAHQGEKGEHVGSFSRTDKNIQVDYPEEADYPRSKPLQGRGGMHYKRTLAGFSLDGRVGLVTGGARGLGLVMSQALVLSGADVAIIDLNSTRTRDVCH